MLFSKKDSVIIANEEEICEHSKIVWEQLMMYFVYTYFCGAVYDGRAYTRMKFAVLGTLLIRELSRSLWISNKRNSEDQKGVLEDIEEAARRYSREIEHSDYNKNQIFNFLENEKEFGISDFLEIL